jgi:hypothetical protein
MSRFSDLQKQWANKTTDRSEEDAALESPFARPPGPDNHPAVPTSAAKSAEERKAILDSALARAGGRGWRIETRSDFQAMIAQGHRVNHILHLILSIITFGLWLIVWILMGVFGGEKRAMVTVDEYGNVQEQRT